MGYIYLITNTINNKQYVGQTKRADVEERWRYHKKCSDKTIGRYLLAAYKKYGIDKFKFQIICVCFDEDCDKYEEEYIKKFNTLSPNGYNLKSGGHFSKHHPDTKIRMSESVKNSWTEERKKHFSENFSGENAPNYGKKISEEQKEKLRNAHKNYWKNMSKEEYNSICQERKGRIHGKNPSQKVLDALEKGRKISKNINKKRIGKYDSSGNLLESFDSITEASRTTVICHSTISKVCLQKGHYKTAGGFVWKYIA
jgi:group I intron endonuclease